MRKFFAECIDVIDFLMEELAKHRWITTGVMAFWIILTVVLNAVYYGRPIPVTHTVLKPIWAYTNVICAGIVGGFTIGYVNKSASKN